jgi:hypothetical protein
MMAPRPVKAQVTIKTGMGLKETKRALEGRVFA